MLQPNCRGRSCRSRPEHARGNRWVERAGQMGPLSWSRPAPPSLQVEVIQGLSIGGGEQDGLIVSRRKCHLIRISSKILLRHWPPGDPYGVRDQRPAGGNRCRGAEFTRTAPVPASSGGNKRPIVQGDNRRSTPGRMAPSFRTITWPGTATAISHSSWSTVSAETERALPRAG